MYSLTRNIMVRDRPVCVRGDGIGISKLMWGSGAPSAGLTIVQVSNRDRSIVNFLPQRSVA